MIILTEDKSIMSLLPPDDAKQVLLALFSTDDDIPEMTPLANMAYITVKNKSDRLTKAQNEFSTIQSKNGKKGGAPIGNQNAKKK